MEVSEFVAAKHIAAVIGGTLIEEVPDLPAEASLAQEWKTFKREVYRLICYGYKGRFALIKGDQVVSVWDTFGDATQAGQERFGQEPFLVHEVQLYVKSFLRPIRSGYVRLIPKTQETLR